MKDSLVETFDGPIRAHYGTVYLIGMDLPDDTGVIVKIGTAERPMERYQNLITGLPFPSVMFWSPAGRYRYATCIEHECHRALASYRTTREWFRFRDEAALNVMRSSVKEAFEEWKQPSPEWHRITEDRLREAQRDKMQSKKDRERTRNVFA